MRVLVRRIDLVRAGWCGDADRVVADSDNAQRLTRRCVDGGDGASSSRGAFGHPDGAGLLAAFCARRDGQNRGDGHEREHELSKSVISVHEWRLL
jgi:hypothetical protein